MSKELTPFTRKVVTAVSLVPYGKVASYGQIALLLGMPRAARQVGWALNGLEESIIEKDVNLPWWRIVNNFGRISIKGTKYHDALLQKKLLEQEGITFLGDFDFPIEHYRFVPTSEDYASIALLN